MTTKKTGTAVSAEPVRGRYDITLIDKTCYIINTLSALGESPNMSDRLWHENWLAMEQVMSGEAPQFICFFTERAHHWIAVANIIEIAEDRFK